MGDFLSPQSLRRITYLPIAIFPRTGLYRQWRETARDPRLWYCLTGDVPFARACYEIYDISDPDFHILNGIYTWYVIFSSINSKLPLVKATGAPLPPGRSVWIESIVLVRMLSAPVSAKLGWTSWVYNALRPRVVPGASYRRASTGRVELQ